MTKASSQVSVSKHMDKMRVSKRGLAEIASHEALVLSPYKDSVGIWTVGIGHVLNVDKDTPKDVFRTFSMSEVINLFLHDIARFEYRVRETFTRPLMQEQFDAAVSFDFNTGAIHRASWVKHFNNHDLTKSKKSFMLWRRPPEIIPRRKKERNLFFDGVYSNDGNVTIYPVSLSGYPVWARGKETPFLDEIKRYFLIPSPDVSVLPSPDVSVLPSSSQQDCSISMPLFRPQLDDTVIFFLLEKFSFLTPIERRNDQIKVLMLRGYSMNSTGSSGVNERDCYDDAVFVITPDGIQSFNGNTDPSVYRKGIATIKSSQAIRYRPGLHGYANKTGPYPAFRQDAPCTVERDDEGNCFGMFAVNLHRGGVTETISSGCLTIPSHQWREFYGDLFGLLKKYNQANFFVTLLSASKEEALRECLSSEVVSGGTKKYGPILHVFIMSMKIARRIGLRLSRLKNHTGEKST